MTPFDDKTMTASSKNLILPLAAVGIIASMLLLVVILWVTSTNANARFKNQFTAQEQVIEAAFDDMWKSIQQVAQVDDKYRTDLRDTILGNASARTAGGGSLATLVTEAVPNISPETANRLMGVIDGRREGFKREQNVLAGIAQQNNNLVDTFPGSLFLGAGDRLTAKIVSSTRTQEAIKSRTDDNVDVYGK